MCFKISIKLLYYQTSGYSSVGKSQRNKGYIGKKNMIKHQEFVNIYRTSKEIKKKILLLILSIYRIFFK